MSFVQWNAFLRTKPKQWLFLCCAALLVLVAFQPYQEVPSPIRSPIPTRFVVDRVSAVSSNEKDISDSNEKDISDSHQQDHDCPFRDSPLYRSIFVYPNPHTETSLFAKLRSNFTSNSSNNVEWPWILQRDKIRRDGTLLYDIDNPTLSQFALDLVVYEIINGASSCLRTNDPETAQLFFVPFLPSVFRRGGGMEHDSTDQHTSSYEQALANAMTGQSYEGWETVFGLTSDYWKRREGTDHFVVMPEPLHGLYHPRGKRGFHHYIKTQKQLWAPIVISVEVSRTFMETYPRCHQKNILVPYPNIDGRWYNGDWDQRASELLRQQQPHLQQYATNKRPLWLYYNAGNHGECLSLRKALKIDHDCEQQQDPNDALLWQELSNQTRHQSFPLGMRLATFCPCPGGDSPSAKRMFDAVLAGCIPVILSKDFVWPFAKNNSNNSTTTGPVGIPPSSLSSPIKNPTKHQPLLEALYPDTFALHLNAQHFEQPVYHLVDNGTANSSCRRIKTSPPTENHPQQESLAEYLHRTVTQDEIKRLQEGVRKAAIAYSYFSTTATAALSRNPLQEGMLPLGGVARRLVDELAHRATMGSQYWRQCQQEKASVIKQTGGKIIVTENKC